VQAFISLFFLFFLSAFFFSFLIAPEICPHKPPFVLRREEFKAPGARTSLAHCAALIQNSIWVTKKAETLEDEEVSRRGFKKNSPMAQIW
jgi:hypothetical protein